LFVVCQGQVVKFRVCGTKVGLSSVGEGWCGL
ncbi:MAG: hypothetical protein FD167_6030, partial [bacterium]